MLALRKLHQQGRAKGAFGAKENYEWGVDRYDGGTLNRFINIDPLQHANTDAFSKLDDLKALTAAICGGRQRSRHVWFYQTIHGDEAGHADPQKNFHRDTFFSCAKFWYFLEPETPEDGPFEYVPGSHRITPARLEWEKRKASGMIARERGRRSGSFRISRAELDAMGYGPSRKLAVPENTMIIADTFDFHRRGDARTGTDRLALYGNMRPWPFSPVCR